MQLFDIIKYSMTGSGISVCVDGNVSAIFQRNGQSLAHLPNSLNRNCRNVSMKR